MQVQLENIPQYLKTNGQFCNWKYELRNGNQTKVPYMPDTTRRASVDDPSTFKPFDVAVVAKSYDGIGMATVFSASKSYTTASASSPCRTLQKTKKRHSR